MNEEEFNKELDRDIRNLFIPEEERHIPYVENFEDLNCYSKESIESLNKMIEAIKNRIPKPEKE